MQGAKKKALQEERRGKGLKVELIGFAQSGTGREREVGEDREAREGHISRISRQQLEYIKANSHPCSRQRC